MTSRRSRLQEDTYFRVLRILQDRPDITQREIAKLLGISTSGLNYCLNALIDKGWVKVHNFSESKNKFGRQQQCTHKIDCNQPDPIYHAIPVQGLFLFLLPGPFSIRIDLSGVDFKMVLIACKPCRFID